MLVDNGQIHVIGVRTDEMGGRRDAVLADLAGVLGVRPRFPGVHAELVPRRRYPHGTLAAHVLGYTAEVAAEQLAQPVFDRYDPGTQVGMAGVERTHEATLHGRPGRRRLQVDASRDVVRQVSERPPTAGADLRLTLDLAAQRLVEDALATGLRRARKLADPEGRGDGTFAAALEQSVV